MPSVKYRFAMSQVSPAARSAFAAKTGWTGDNWFS